MTIIDYDDGDGHFDRAYRCDKCKDQEWSYSLPDGWMGESGDEGGDHFCYSCTQKCGICGNSYTKCDCAKTGRR